MYNIAIKHMKALPYFFGLQTGISIIWGRFIDTVEHHGFSCETNILNVFRHIKHVDKLIKVHKLETLGLALNSCDSYKSFTNKYMWKTITLA